MNYARLRYLRSYRFDPVDVAIYALLLGFGALCFTSSLNSSGELADARYVEIARSIVERGTYEFNYRPETMIPPGFPLILALILRLAGYAQSVQFHLIAVFTTLALVATYDLIRRLEGRPVAVAISLLLASAPPLFAFSTRIVFSDMPYFAVSMLALIFALRLGDSEPGRRPFLVASMALLIVMSAMIRSTGIAMIIGLGTWIVISFLTDLRLGRRRLALFMIPLLLGLTAQLIWMAWAGRHQFAEWPLAGYPGSYLSQLKLKTGNHPELGAASFSDIPGRVAQNLIVRTSELVKLLSRREWITPYWCSPAIFGFLALTTAGWITSVRKTGGQLHDWYFVSHELVYALWPWNYEPRFLLPIVPLACLYSWRGARYFWRFVTRPNSTGLWAIVAVAAVLTFASAKWGAQTNQLQAVFSALFWALTLVIASALLTPLRSKIQTIWNVALLPILARFTTLILVTALVLKGFGGELRIARSNRTFDTSQAVFFPDVEAGKWIASSQPSNVVVMARKQDLVFHYCQRQVVWFPPITDPIVLMQGISKHHVDLIVLSERDDGYFQPTQQVCFDSLLRMYPSSFNLVYQGCDYRIYQVNDRTASLFHSSARAN